MEHKAKSNLTPVLDQPVLKTPQTNTPKTPGGLAVGNLIDANQNHEYTVVLCDKCEKPLWRVFPIVDNGPSYEQKEAEPLGHSEKMPRKLTDTKKFKCPFCNFPFARYANTNGTEHIRYKTNKGII